jgi:PAS domain S-box-containing protein
MKRIQNSGAAPLTARLNFASDITERKEAEGALRASEERFRMAAQTTNDVLYEWDLKQGVQWFGDIDKTLGYGPGEFPRTLGGWVAAVHPEDRERVMAAVKAHLEGRAPYVAEYRVRRKDGVYQWWSARGAVTRAPDGKPVRWIGSITDITERKRMEEGLRGLTERLRSLHRIDRAILQAVESPEAIAQTALQHLRGVLHCQRASVGIFDLEKKQVQVFAAEVKGETIVQTGKDLAEEAYGDLEILRQGSMEIIEDMSRVRSPSAVAQLLRAEGIRSSINVPLLSANGLIGALNVGWEDARAITPEEMEIAGEVAGQIAIAIELAHLLQATKRHAAELEQRVQDRTAQLEAANKELEAFSYSVSHDLRAPLRHVQGYVHMLAREAQGQLSDKGRRLLKTIVDASKEMGVLIDDLLGFSRMARAEMGERRVSLDGLVQESIQCLGTATRGRNIIWKIPPLPSVLGDPAMLKQAFANLLANAVKYSRPRNPAQIEVGFDGREGERVILFVRDNGVGFDPQYVHKLFGVFQRLHRAEEFEGTGIGLANVRRIIARHGGRTWAEGALDRGATFYFTLKPSSSPNPVN